MVSLEAKAIAREISAIRLHLKRLEYDRQAVVERARRGSGR